MIKKWILLATLCLGFLFAKSTSLVDSSQSFKKMKLGIEEINILGSYYSQNGRHSAVTGGEGTERLTDLSGNADITLYLLTPKNYKHSLKLNFGIDQYTSASSDKIDPNSISSPSYSDVRIYPSVNYNFTNQNKQFTIGTSAYYSTEYDYKSIGFGLNFSKTFSNGMSGLDIHAMSFFDQWKVIKPVELRPDGYGSGSEDDKRPIDYKARNSYSVSVVYSQIINKKLQLALVTEPSYQQGLLSMPFQRVYLNDGTARIEKLPSQRIKIPLAFRLNYFYTKLLVFRSFYRFYYDDWGLNSNTFQIEMPIKAHPFITIMPLYRLALQNQSRYFNVINKNSPTQEFYTSDYDLSTFNSHLIGLHFQYQNPNGIMRIKFFNSVTVRGSYYLRSDGLRSWIMTLALQFK